MVSEDTSSSVDMKANSMTTSSMSRQKVVHEIEKKICAEIRQTEADIRATYPIFHQKYQDLLGAAVFFGSLGMIIFTWYWYLTNQDHPARYPLAIISVAFWTSFIHELEHDLIHNLYFKSNNTVHFWWFLAIWIIKMNTSPFTRKELHLRHHRVSGQMDDIEERLIGLGLPFGWRRMCITAHPVGMIVATYETAKDNAFVNVKKLNLESAPVVLPFLFFMKMFLIFNCCLFLVFPSFAQSSFAQSTFMQWIWHINVLSVMPGILRQGCLQMMSNCSHYYGDIPSNSLFYQNQILDHWIFFPFQVFCCNFGATHIIHHYIPQQPFYIRELVYRRVRYMMEENGVRRNDLGIILRGNRYFNSVEEARKVVGDEKAIPELPKTIESHILAALFPANWSMVIWAYSAVVAGSLFFPLVDIIVSYAFTWRLMMKYVFKSKQL
jgi:hypothetical protein